MGKNYTGNPRYIYEEMVSQNLDKVYSCYYFFENPDKVDIPGNAKKIKRTRFRYYYLMAIAKIWVFDCRVPSQIIKRKETTYIQTWHGTPLKKLALDMDNVFMAGSQSIKTYKENFYKNTRRWDYLISQNPYSTEIFRRCFAFKKQILEIGYPRNDILFKNNTKDYILSVKKILDIPLNKKVILYAPTWRDNEYYEKGKYKFIVKIDFNQLRRELEDEYIFIVKYHYLVNDQVDWERYKGFIYNFDNSYDIADLYLISDAMITDYSSVMFDYSILKRPIFFYAYDLDDYKENLRGFYFDFIGEVPGPISKTTSELIHDIKNYNIKDYEEKFVKFIENYNLLDDGTASWKVVMLINKLMEKNEN